MGTSQIVTLPILTKLAANFKMAATPRFAKLFSGKRKAVEEGLYSFQRLNDEMANKCFTRELAFETEVAQASVAMHCPLEQRIGFFHPLVPGPPPGPSILVQSLSTHATSCPGPSPRSKWRSEKPLAKAAKVAPKIL